MPSTRARAFFALGAGSARDVLIATAVAGGSGYAITVAAGAVLGNDAYLPFAAFWSALYLIVGALAGVQHETTRASRTPVPDAAEGTLARSVFLVSAGASVVILASSSPLWIPLVFDEHGWAMLGPILLGAVGYLAICVASGVLAGIASWRLVAAISIADALLRAVAFGVTLALTNSVVALAWSVAVPFGVVGLIGALMVKGPAQGKYVIPERLSVIAWNSSRTVLSGAAMGALITGLPAILAATSAASDSDTVSSIAYVSSLVRSPLIVVTMAFQGLLVQRLRDAARGGGLVARLLALIGLAVIAVTAMVAVAGPRALDVLGRGEYTLSGGHMALLVASAAPTAAMFVTGAALLARSRHGSYLGGWLAAAVAAVLGLTLGLPLWTGVAIAVFAAPMLGLTVHVIALRSPGVNAS